MANATGLFKVSNGLRANYDLLPSKDANTMYVCHGDTGYKHGLFVDGERVAVDGKLENLTGANAGQVTINIDGDTATVYNTTAINNMISSIISGITWKGDISVSNLKLVTNYKVGWLYRINSTTGNPWDTNVDLEVGDYVLCINDYNSAFAATDFVVWERNLTGAITCIDGINGWSTGNFNPICSLSGAGDFKATEVVRPTSILSDGLFLKYIHNGDTAQPAAQIPEWSTAVEPDNYPTAKLTNHALIVGRGDNKVTAIAPPAAKGYILLSNYNSGALDPQWLAGEGSNHDGYVLTWNSTTQLPEWRVAQSAPSSSYYLNSPSAGYVSLVTAPGVGTLDIFSQLNAGGEGIIIYDEAGNTATNPATGKTSKLILPPAETVNTVPTTGILQYSTRVATTGYEQDPQLGFATVMSSITYANGNPSTGTNRSDLINLGAVYDALAWGTF